MSKIQKALGVLREERDASEQKARPQYGAHTRQNLTDGAARDERLPTTTICVDLAELQKLRLVPEEDDFDNVRQEFRRIKRPILNLAFKENLSDVDHGNVIMVSSALPKTGKTFCSINLAMSIARERDVGAVLVDADVLKPNISRALGLENHIGLIDYLLDPAVSIDEILVGTDIHGIVIVPAGRQHEESTELLASRRMEEFVDTLAQRFPARAIIVDTPPLLLTNEANVLAENMGQIVLVIEAGESTEESVAEALGMLNRDKPINAILNKSRGVEFGAYGSGNGYYGGEERGYGYGQEEA